MKRRRIDTLFLYREREKLGWRSLGMTGGSLFLLAVSFLLRPIPHGEGGSPDGGRGALTAFLPSRAEEAPALPGEEDERPTPRMLPTELPPNTAFSPPELSLPAPLPPNPDASPMPPMELVRAGELPPPPSAPPLLEFNSSLPAPTAPPSPPAPQTRKREAALADHPASPSSSKPTAVAARASSLSSSGEHSRTRSAAYRHAPRPPYPPSLRERRIEGSVRVRIFIDASGAPTDVKILTGSGHREFDDTARRWILRQWSFFPAEENGRPTAGSVTTQIHFIMD